MLSCEESDYDSDHVDSLGSSNVSFHRLKATALDLKQQRASLWLNHTSTNPLTATRAAAVTLQPGSLVKNQQVLRGFSTLNGRYIDSYEVDDMCLTLLISWVCVLCGDRCRKDAGRSTWSYLHHRAWRIWASSFKCVGSCILPVQATLWWWCQYTTESSFNATQWWCTIDNSHCYTGDTDSLLSTAHGMVLGVARMLKWFYQATKIWNSFPSDS